MQLHHQLLNIFLQDRDEGIKAFFRAFSPSYTGDVTFKEFQKKMLKINRLHSFLSKIHIQFLTTLHFISANFVNFLFHMHATFIDRLSVQDEEAVSAQYTRKMNAINYDGLRSIF